MRCDHPGRISFHTSLPQRHGDAHPTAVSHPVTASSPADAGSGAGESGICMPGDASTAVAQPESLATCNTGPTALELKACGNEHFKKKHFHLATRAYTQALQALGADTTCATTEGPVPGSAAPRSKETSSLAAILHSNRAAGTGGKHWGLRRLALLQQS